ncbi:DUF4291 domain-containing protein [Kitasatospora sp. NPDC059571]|uniref:DUF4291 domain-containing protein n=1 Tax=Kitasatospora sp. NPDC059571 TaxID=3346871 RepID=UPI00368C9E0B
MGGVRTPLRQIRAVYTEDTVTLYQAFVPEIAGPAAEHGRFPAAFDRGRMTWVKPSFLWMMYRSDWARAAGQERVLAVTVRREGFEWALARAVPSGYDAERYRSRDAWRRDVRRGAVRIQWDPERDLQLRAMPWRSLQLGLRGEAVARYADEWITGIEDVTGLARRVHRERTAALLPAERPYPLPVGIAARLGAGAGDPL